MRALLFALFMLVAIGAAEAQKGAAVCPNNNVADAETLTCRCDATVLIGSVWGSGPYTNDSSICAAAAHAGLLSAEGIGTVTLNHSEGCVSYAPSTQNGVTTLAYGSWNSSYFFPNAGGADCAGTVGNVQACPSNMGGQGDSLTCACSAEATTVGSIWGTNVYTDDSAICKAALHSGAIGPGGGVVQVMRAPGMKAYPASTANGVESLAYGSWQGSFLVSLAEVTAGGGGK